MTTRTTTRCHARAWGARRCALVAATAALAPALVAAPAPVVAAPASGWGEVRTLQEGRFLLGVEDVVVASDGRAVATWLDETRTDRLWAARRPVGGAWSKPFAVSPKGHTVLTSDAVSWGGGRVTVYWQDFVGDRHFRLWERTAGPDGWGRTQLVADVRGTRVVGLSADRDAAGDEVVASPVAGGAAAVVRRHGSDWQPADPFPADGATVEGVVAAAGGRSTVVYATSDDDVHAVDLAADGSWSGATVVGPGARASVASNAAGDLAVVWTRAAQGGRIGTVRSRPADGDWQPAARLPGRTSLFEPMVAGDGSVAVAYDDEGARESRTRIRLVRGPGDGTLGTPQLLYAKDVWVYQSTFDAAIGADGTVVLAHDRRTGGDDRAVATRCVDGGACSTYPYGDDPDWYDYASVGVGPNGGGVTAWANGCRTEACYATSIRARLLGPPA